MPKTTLVILEYVLKIAVKELWLKTQHRAKGFHQIWRGFTLLAGFAISNERWRCSNRFREFLLSQSPELTR
jgi:hypothetical protein